MPMSSNSVKPKIDPLAPDSLTVLEPMPHDGQTPQMRKTWRLTSDGWKQSPAPTPTFWRARSVVVKDLDTLGEAFVEFSKGPRIFIHGGRDGAEDSAPITLDGEIVTPPKGFIPKRKSHFKAVPRAYAIFDLDEGFPLADPKAAAEAIRAKMPEEFKVARCFYTATASHGFKPESRMRLVFWLSRPLLPETVFRLATSSGVKFDGSLFREVQPIYIQKPAIIGGADPVAERAGFLDGKSEVAIPDSVVDAPKASAVATLPETVVINSARGVAEFVRATCKRDVADIKKLNRRNSIDFIAKDAAFCALEEDLAFALGQVFLSPPDDAAEVISAAMEALNAAGHKADAVAWTNRLHRAGKAVADVWGDRDPLEDWSIRFDAAYRRGCDKFGQRLAGREDPTDAFGSPDVETPMESSMDADRRAPGDQAVTTKSAPKAASLSDVAQAAETALEALDGESYTHKFEALVSLGATAGEVGMKDVAKAASNLADLVDGLGDDAELEAADTALRDLIARSFKPKAATKKEKAKPFALNLIPYADIAKVDVLNSPYVVKGLIDKGSVNALVAPSTFGKTFVALHIGACVADGTQCFKRRVKQGKVVYLAAEGHAGIEKRVKALGKQRKWATPDFFLIKRALNLLDEKQGESFALAMEQASPALIVIDTVHVATGGVEETNENFGKFVFYCRELARRSGAAILLVHHTGKDEKKGARGGSAFKADIDNEILLKKSKEGTPYLDGDKIKDGPDGAIAGFKLRSVSLGKDADGDEVTTCVVDEAAGDTGEAFGTPDTEEAPKALSPNHRAVLDALAALCGVKNKPVTPTAISERSGLTKNQVDRALARLNADHLILSEGRGAWSLPAKPTEPEDDFDSPDGE